MLSDILFSLDRVMPYFLLIVLGFILRKSGLVSRDFFRGANRFTFRVALPFLLFYNIIMIDKNAGSAGGFMLYVLVVTLASFGAVWALTELVYRNDKAVVGTLVQGAFRGNFVLLGIPLADAVLGSSAAQIAALASIIIVPAYNALSVVVLLARGADSEKRGLAGILRGIVANPLVIAMFFAIPLWLLDIRLPQVPQTTVAYVSAAAVPLGLLSIGGLLNLPDVTARIRPALYSVLLKNFVLPAVIVFISYYAGFRNEELLVLLVLSAAPVAVSSYAMASEMGGDAPLASNILILSTFISAFVLAFGIYVLRSFALI